MEIWKRIHIKDMEKVYYISNMGNIKNNRGQLLKQRYDKYGYKRITFTYKDENKKTIQVTKFIHRLVAEAFLECDDINNMNVRFKDGNKNNVIADNLIYTNKSIISKKRKFNNRNCPVYNITTNMIYKNMSTAAKILNINVSSIYKCCNNLDKTAGGYSWKYL